MRLGVNIDHVATLRNARGGIHPDPIKAAVISEKAGADLIVVGNAIEKNADLIVEISKAVHSV